jgi:hypothetical protein
MGGEVANCVTIKRCYQRQCGAVSVDSSTRLPEVVNHGVPVGACVRVLQ